MSYTFFDDTSVVRPAQGPGYAPGFAPEKTARPGLYLRGGKRIFDIAVSLLVLPFVLPTVLCLWAVMFLNGGSGFYAQPRVGRGGRLFRCLKIRTMAPDADRLLETYLAGNPEIAAEWHRNQKLRNDPRITRLGRFLRRTSLDELPQIWNVLKGDMSLVGPRPFTPDQKALYDAETPVGSYYRLRPGITGPWQVGARNLGAFRDRVHYDEDYAANVTFLRDLAIGLKTVVVVLKATGT